MTTKQHVITIPAREVVPGMRVINALQRHCAIVAVDIEDVSTGHLRIRGPAIDWSMPGDATLAVTLPGPSPRELLCSCPSAFGGLPGSEWMRPPHEHQGSKSIDCPVRRLRLRVWPAPFSGMPWSWETGKYSGWTNDRAALLVEPDNLRAALAESQSLRACFCLPAAHAGTSIAPASPSGDCSGLRSSSRRA